MVESALAAGGRTAAQELPSGNRSWNRRALALGLAEIRYR